MRCRQPIVLALTALIATACSVATPAAPRPSSDPASPDPPSASGPPSGTPAEPAAIAVAQSASERAPATDADAAAAASAINSFGTDVYRLLVADDENVVFSPASIAFALGLVRPGARGETAEEIDAVSYDVASAEHGTWLNGLDGAIAKRSGTFRDTSGKEVDVILRIANTAFAQDGFPLEEAYLDEIATRLGAGIQTLDFASDADAARRAINGWVADQTEDRIPELLLPDDVDAATRLFLVNAIYLKAPWHLPFPEGMTEPAPFIRADGSTVRVPTMTSKMTTTCGEGTGWRSIELPYAGGSLTMTVVVPDDLAGFEAQLNGQGLAALVAETRDECHYVVTLPRFEVESRVNLAETLGALGMRAAFDPARADFSGITAAAPLHIASVIHQANMSVDEQGTEAAAATAIGMALSDAPAFEVNRPFLFAVRDGETGAVLFFGRITDPSIGS